MMKGFLLANFMILYFSMIVNSQEIKNWQQSLLDDFSKDMTGFKKIDEKLYAYGNLGVWRLDDESDGWSHCAKLGMVKDIDFYSEIYYASTFGDGLYSSVDQISWNKVKETDNFRIHNMDIIDGIKYVSTMDGLFILAEDKMERVTISGLPKLSNQIFFKTAKLGEFIIAFGEKNCFLYDINLNQLEPIDINYYMNPLKIIEKDSSILVSTSGNGAYSLGLNRENILTIEENASIESKYSLGVTNIDSDLYYTKDKSIYKNDELFAEFDTWMVFDLYFFNDMYYACTKPNGIFRTSDQLNNRSQDLIQVDVRPQPSDGKFEVCVKGVLSERATLQIVKIDGKQQIIDTEFGIKSRNNKCIEYDLPLEGLHAIYINNDKETIIKKIIIIK